MKVQVRATRGRSKRAGAPALVPVAEPEMPDSSLRADSSVTAYQTYAPETGLPCARELLSVRQRDRMTWINYYGQFYPSALVPSLKGIDQYLMRWATQKYKRLRRRRSRAWRGLEKTAKLYPGLFAHWRILRPRTTG